MPEPYFERFVGKLDERMALFERRVDGLMRTMELIEIRIGNLRNE